MALDVGVPLSVLVQLVPFFAVAVLSVVAGVLLLRLKKMGLLLSFIAQVPQLVSFSLFGIAYSFHSLVWLYFVLGVGGIGWDAGAGLVEYHLGPAESGDLSHLGLNLVALLVIAVLVEVYLDPGFELGKGAEKQEAA